MHGKMTEMGLAPLTAGAILIALGLALVLKLEEVRALWDAVRRRMGRARASHLE